MKFVSYLYQGKERLGVLTPDLQSVRQVTGYENAPAGQILLDVIAAWDKDGPQAVRTDDHPVPLESVELLAPVPLPRRNIFCVGKNYLEHVSEFNNSGFETSNNQSKPSAPDRPIFFTKAPSSVIGPHGSIEAHVESTSCLDYEAELVVIIGRKGRRIDVEQAWDHVWGYTLINDVTARDLQRDRQQWFLGKSLDTFCPMGPWAVSADEVDPLDIDIQCVVNDEVRQQANTRDLIFDIPTLIADLSRGITLEPGDLIATGTPSGVGVGFNPPRFLTSGDSVSVSATGLGVLANTVG